MNEEEGEDMIQDDQDSSDEFEIGIEKAGGINFN